MTELSGRSRGHPRVLRCASIKLFRSMRHCVFVILALSGAMDHGIPWHRAVYFGPMEQRKGKCSCIAQHALIHRLSTANRRRSLVGSVLGFWVISLFAFLLKHFFLVQGFESPLSHISTKFCPPFTVHWSIGQNIPHGIPWSIAPPLSARQNRRIPMPHWTENWDRLTSNKTYTGIPQNGFIYVWWV